MNRSRLIGATVALAIIVVTSGVNAGVEWTRASHRASATTPQEPTTDTVYWLDRHTHKVDKMVARHPNATVQTTSYEYVSNPSSGELIMGTEYRVLVGKGIWNPCWYHATFSGGSQPTRAFSGSCQGNG